MNLGNTKLLILIIKMIGGFFLMQIQERILNQIKHQLTIQMIVNKNL